MSGLIKLLKRSSDRDNIDYVDLGGSRVLLIYSNGLCYVNLKNHSIKVYGEEFPRNKSGRPLVGEDLIGFTKQLLARYSKPAPKKNKADRYTPSLFGGG